MTTQIFTYESAAPGPHVLIFGAIHGDEVCGTRALDRLRAELDSGQLALASGKLTVVPVCNPEAYRQNRRYVDKNLNRIFADGQAVDPAVYETTVVKPLMALIRSCDVFLDLHSYDGGTIPLTLLDFDTPATRKLMAAIAIPDVLVGWPELYAGRPDLSAGDTVEYAIKQGKDAIIVECGQHRDPASIEVAYNTARRVLAEVGVLPAPTASVKAWRVCRMTAVITREEGGVMTKPWAHMDAFRKGDVLASYSDGRTVIAPTDGYVVLPKVDAQVGNEWFYLGVLEDFSI